MKYNIVPTSEYFVIDGMKFGQITIEAVTKLAADKCFPGFQDSFRHFLDEETDNIWKIFQRQRSMLRIFSLVVSSFFNQENTFLRI